MMGREKAVALLLCGVRLEEEEAKASPPPLCPTACLGHGEQLLGAPFLRWQLGVGTGTTAAAFDHLSPRGGDMLSSQDRCEGQECGPKGRVACAPAQSAGHGWATTLQKRLQVRGDAGRGRKGREGELKSMVRGLATDCAVGIAKAVREAGRTGARYCRLEVGHERGEGDDGLDD